MIKQSIILVGGGHCKFCIGVIECVGKLIINGGVTIGCGTFIGSGAVTK